MSVYLTVIFEYATREDESRDGYPGENARGYVCEPVSDTPPVALSGLVKGGEFSTARELRCWQAKRFVEGTAREWTNAAVASIYVDANGKAFSSPSRALREGALPLTWYTEAP